MCPRTTLECALLGILDYATCVTLYSTMQFLPIGIVAPRLILSFRKLYACDLQGRCGGDIDMAFGMSLVSGHGTVISEIVFADVWQNNGNEESEEHGEEIQMVERVTPCAGSDA